MYLAAHSTGVHIMLLKPSTAWECTLLYPTLCKTESFWYTFVLCSLPSTVCFQMYSKLKIYQGQKPRARRSKRLCDCCGELFVIKSGDSRLSSKRTAGGEPVTAGSTSRCSFQQYFLVLNQDGCDINDIAELEDDLKIDRVSLHC